MVKQLIGIQVHYIRFPGGSSNRISKNYCHGIMSQLTREVIKQGINIMRWNGDTTRCKWQSYPNCNQSLNKLQVKHTKYCPFST